MTPLSRFWSWPLVRLEQLIRLASLLCALVVIGATLSHALQLREAIQTAAESRLQTVSRVLAKEVNRSLLQTRGLLDQVDDALRSDGPNRSPALDALLEALPRQQTLLREIAVLDRRPSVVTSASTCRGTTSSGSPAMRACTSVSRRRAAPSAQAVARRGPSTRTTGS